MAVQQQKKSFKEKTLDDIYSILTERQYDEIKQLNTKEEITKYIENYWNNVDNKKYSITKDEYSERLEYTNKYFSDRRGWGRSDRKRIYLIYGPPTFIEREEFSVMEIGHHSSIKSQEVWLYMTKAKETNFASQGDYMFRGMKKFIFADIYGAGVYSLFYSSEENGNTDIRLFYK